MTTATTHPLYEVNLYCELSYPGNTEKERYDKGLCDLDLIFLTKYGENASVDDYLMDAAQRYPEDMAVFFAEHYSNIKSFDIESHDSQDEGPHHLGIDEVLVNDNECPWSNWLEDADNDDEDEEEEGED
jgi:hypothetical protein